MRTAPVPNMAAIPGMNPGLFVMGGGGDGGGGDGSGGDGKGGKQGADGKNGGNNANGGGKGAGACGAGGPGACTNCGHNISRGDPVDVVSGKVFTIPKRDLFLPGHFSLDFLRSYSTSSRDVDLGMGYGWVHSLAWSIHERRRTLALATGDGRLLELPRPQETGGHAQAGSYSVIRGGEFYAVRAGNEFEHYFAQVEPQSSSFRLRFVRFRNRGQIALQYENGVLARAVDTAGRVILFHSNPQGRITSIAVPDPRGQTIVFARYAYDEHGHMVAATDAEGHTTYYDYDEDHRMTRLEYPNGVVFHYVYDRHGRCVETWGDTPGRQDPALAPGLGETLADGKTPAKGIFHIKTEFAEDNSYAEVVDAVRTQRFFAGPDGTVGKAVSGRGGVTSRVYDAKDRVVTKTDAEGGVWTYAYNDMDKVVREVDPDGNSVTVTYDGAGAETEIVDPAGGVTTIGRDAHGEITLVKDAAGGVLQLSVNAVGGVVQALDSRGGQTLFEWDGHGNCTARTFPNGARMQYEYDWWGRRIREIDANGEQIQFSYDNSGRLVSRVDAVGRPTSYRYDSMGNLVSQTRADGASMVREYGGLNWLCRVRHADGSELRGYYNREGWMVALENEKGERYSFEHDADGLVSWEKDFQGQEHRFGHDLLGRLVWYEDASGRFERKLSPAGLLLAEEAPDGSVREFEYNPRGEMIRAATGDCATEMQRDPNGRVVRETLHVDGKSYTVESRRSPAGDRTEMRTSLGLEMQVRRDLVGRVTEIWNGKERVLGITRNLLSQPVRRDLNGGGAIVDTYDAVRRLRRRQILGPGAPAQSVGEPAWVGGVIPGVVERQYDYTTINEIEKVTSSDGNDVEYEYDVRRHLSKVRRGRSIEEFRSDAAGNDHEVGPSAPPRVYDKGNQLARWSDCAYQYDGRGYLTEKRKVATSAAGAEEITRYKWNAWGMLESVEMPDGTKVELSYDPFARRLGKRVIREGRVVESRHYVWDLVSIAQEVDTTAEGGPKVRSYLFEDNDDCVPLGHKEGENWVHYVNDVNGVPEEIVDGAGRSVGKLSRTPFGRTRLAAGSVSTPFRHPGQLDDPEIGLHYNRYRYYDPDTGRFISPDPLGINGNFNLYQFAPNPIGWSDPMGWQHQMGVQTTDPTWPPATNFSTGGTGGTYNSGTADVPCQADLATRANCHTEQKFAQDLIDHHNAQVAAGGTGAAGQQYNLNGQLPPCPTCHQALRAAAAETGANITYSWGAPNPGSINYNGAAPLTPSSFTGSGNDLAPTYGAPATPNPDRRWDASSAPGSQAAYNTLRSQFP